MVTKIKSASATCNVNYKFLPVTVTTNIDEWNELYQFWKNTGIPKGIERTPSGGIKVPLIGPHWDADVDNVGAEIIACAVIDGVEMYYRYQYRAHVSKIGNKTISGAVAFRMFAEELAKDGVDISKWYIKNGASVKATIPSPRIELINSAFANMTFDNCHHIDINNSYPAGMAEFCPEWRKTIERLYRDRKKVPEYKAVLVYSCGYMQSLSNFSAKLAHVSKYAIELNNKKIERMLAYLRSKECMPIAINTDGIWYSGPLLDINSDKLGWWKTDHKNCKLRYKSPGCYEFIENGKYNVVLRGKTALDKIKPRDKWQWGDIYNVDAEPIQYELTDRGVLQWH